MKMMDGLFSRAMAKSCLTSLYPGKVQGVSLGANKWDWGVNRPLALSHPLAHEIRTADAEKGALGLGRHRLGQVALAGAGGPVEQDALPGLALALEQVGELDGQQDGLLEGLLGALEPGHVVPLDVGPLLQDGAGEGVAQLLGVLVEALAAVDVGAGAVLAGLLALAGAAGAAGAVGAQHAGLLALAVGVGQVGLELLGAVHVLGRLGADHLLGLWVLLPLEREQEQLEGLVVHLVGLVVLGRVVGLDGLAHLLDGAAEEVGV